MGSERSNQGGKMTRQLNNLDRISELPECLIVEILSLLEMKDAVKTGVLSKRWEKLWTSVDCIIYHSDVEEPTDEQLRLFMSFVDDTLMQCTCPNIKKFSLTGYGFLCSELSHNMDMFFQVNDWIKFVLDKNVQSMKLGLSGLIDYGPCCLFGSPSLVSLEIYEIGSFDSFNIYSVRCNLLKHLSFKSVSLEKKFMTKVLLGCPVLETMVLDDTRGFSRLDITSKSLKMLKLCNFEYDDFVWDSGDEYDDYRGNHLVEVNAPWVQDLEISGLFEGVQCQLMDVSSVSTATLTFSYQAHRKVEVDPDGMWFNMVKDILEPVSHVDDLVIGSELVQALSLSYNFYGPSPVFKCKYLTVCSPILKYELPGIIYLLENTTLLERLVLKLLCSQCYFSEYFATIYKEEFTFDALKYVVTQLKGDFPKLKYLEIDYIVMGRQDKGDEMVMESFHQELAFKINRNVSSLEKVVILSLQSENNKLAKAYEKLLSYHKRIGKWELKRMQCRSEFSFCDSAS